MTVAKIKEKINKAIENSAGERKTTAVRYLLSVLHNIKSMLDELEPKAKWTNNMNGTFTCSRCGAKRPNDNYCGNCGARMDDEVDDESKD